MRVSVRSSDRVFDGFFQLDRAVLRFEEHSGLWSPWVERLVFERGDSVAVLLYNPRADRVILVEQFRYPAYVRDHNKGWLLEIVAGTIESSRTPIDVARAEVAEESGYSVEVLDHLVTVFASPGACSERIHIFLALVDGAPAQGAGGGAHDEGEDVRVVEMSLSEAKQAIQDGRVVDAKTVIAIQFLAARLDRATL
jgi:ADP-ribose pyrophosphatase